jgi:hypothetical protein
VVERKARFDEAANIGFVRRLEQFGVQVSYGVSGYKTHCKVILVVRQDYDRLRRYAHIGTGNYHPGTAYYGETTCISDGTLAQATANSARPEVQLFVQGSPEYAMPDNVAYQPGRGNWVIHEDAETDYLRPHNNDLWDCLPDGADPDLLSDGCIRIATLNDLSAEWTGGIFDATGQRFYVSVQHNMTGKGTVLEITGWQ